MWINRTQISAVRISPGAGPTGLARVVTNSGRWADDLEPCACIPVVPVAVLVGTRAESATKPALPDGLLFWEMGMARCAEAGFGVIMPLAPLTEAAGAGTNERAVTHTASLGNPSTWNHRRNSWSICHSS